MDKETLSNYGWIVICILVLSVMIALATPFGKYIEAGVLNTTDGLIGTSQNALDVIGLGNAGGSGNTGDSAPTEPTPEQPTKPETPDPALNPDDGTEPQEGDTYEYGDYEYEFYPDYDGWQVYVLDTAKTEYGTILESINGQPITDMTATFYGCSKLTTAPAIPSSVTDMTSTFYGCTKLTTAPTIPNSVTDMTYTFSGCTSLETAPTIPSSVTAISGIFQDCNSLKTYVDSTDADGDFSNYVMPNGITNTSYAFEYCRSLTTAPTIPNSVTDMSNTFSGCTKLTTAPTIPSGVTDMQGTFSGCTSLETAPVIPEGVTDMSLTFANCTSLETAPTIPSSVINMTSTFHDCYRLTGDIEINTTPTKYDNCFAETAKPIKIIGSCDNKAKLAATSMCYSLKDGYTATNNITY